MDRDLPAVTSKSVSDDAPAAADLTAISSLQAVVDANPDDGHAWEQLGIRRYVHKQIPQAVANLEMATTLTPLSVEGQLALANCYTDQNFRESARAMFVYLSEAQPLSSRQIPDVVRGLAGLGEYRRALILCREAVRRDPECDQALYGMAFYMSKCGAPGEVVVSVLHRVVELAPDIVLYRVALATMHQNLGQIETALQVLTPMTPDHLQRLRCPGCVRKIAKVFEAAGDAARHAACVARLEELN